MKKVLIALLCALLFITSSTMVSAAVTKNFGTATNDLYDRSVDADAPNINNFIWSKTGEGGDSQMDVEITCEFEDHTTDDYTFSFSFLLTIEYWRANPPEYISLWGYDYWNATDEQSANWLNQVYSDTLSVRINHVFGMMYKCTLDVSISNDGCVPPASDYDQETWTITIVP